MQSPLAGSDSIFLDEVPGRFSRFYCSGGLMKSDGNFHSVKYLLATDLSVSLLPPSILAQEASISRGIPLAIDPELLVTDWCGVPCSVAMVTLRTTVLPTAVFRNFTFPVLIPTQSHSWFPDELLLGANFLTRFASQVQIDLVQPGGRFSLPEARIWLL